jgi:DNA-binding NtrC family response regulator
MNLVLFVDDNPNILKAYERTFRDEAYDILTAANADQALEIVRGIDIDVIVTDQRMPGTSGADLLSAMQREFPNIPRIMLTGVNDTKLVMDAVNRCAVFRFFTKPCNDIELAIAIRDAIDHKVLLTRCTHLLEISKKRRNVLAGLESLYPGITTIHRTTSGAVLLEDNYHDAHSLIQEIEAELGHAAPRVSVRSTHEG